MSNTQKNYDLSPDSSLWYMGVLEDIFLLFKDTPGFEEISKLYEIPEKKILAIELGFLRLLKRSSGDLLKSVQQNDYFSKYQLDRYADLQNLTQDINTMSGLEILLIHSLKSRYNGIAPSSLDNIYKWELAVKKNIAQIFADLSIKFGPNVMRELSSEILTEKEALDMIFKSNNFLLMKVRDRIATCMNDNILPPEILNVWYSRGSGEYVNNKDLLQISLLIRLWSKKQRGRIKILSGDVEDSQLFCAQQESDITLKKQELCALKKQLASKTENAIPETSLEDENAEKKTIKISEGQNVETSISDLEKIIPELESHLADIRAKIGPKEEELKKNRDDLEKMQLIYEAARKIWDAPKLIYQTSDPLST